MRFLVIFCLLIGAVSANAATRCVQLNANTAGASAVNTEWQSDWTVTEANGVKLLGVGVCASTGTNTTVQGTVTTSLSYSGGRHSCWCRMVSPAVSKWAFYLYYVDVEQCAQRCNFRCGEYAQQNAVFRAALFNSINQ